MRIGILAPFNPYVIKERFKENFSVPDVNKSATAINTLVREYLDQGHQLIVITYVPEHTFKPVVLEGDNIRIYVLSSRFLLPKAGVFMRWFMPYKLRKCIDQEVNSLDVLHAHWTYDYALAACKYVKRLPVFCTVRDWCPNILKQQEACLDILYWLVSYSVFKRVMSNPDIHFVANSAYTERMIKEKYPEKNLTMSFNPIDKHLILKKRKNDVKAPIFITITGAVDIPGKNIYRLLEAFKVMVERHPNSCLIVVGSMPDSNSPFMNNCRAKNLLDGVVFTGFLSHEEVIKKIDESYCLVHPSLEETFGNIFLEAMARRVPVIGGKNSGAVPYVLGQGKYGLLCDVVDPKSITEAMEKMLDKRFASELVESATLYMYENYSSDIVVKKMVCEYKTCININPLF